MTSLDAFKIIMERIGKGESLEGTYNEFLLIKKDLEVLEILKNKRVNINKIIKVGKLENYNSICAIGTDLTFEEYKAIKNWLERKE